MVAVACTVMLVIACGNDVESRGEPAGGLAEIATNLDVPWGIAFLPDGSALIAERDSAAIKHLTAGVVRDVGSVAGVAARGEGGLLGLATAGSTVYAYLTTGEDNRVVQMRFDDGTLSAQSPILTGIPAGSRHDGGRIAFGPDGKLYVATGEVGDPQLAQDRASLGGKILRINPDGSVPSDNPDPASPVWSYGHRNIQGLAWDSAGRLWATEYGANRVDELNLIQSGANYGWPMAEGRAGTEGLEDPVIEWGTDEASPSGLAYFGGSLWVAALRGERLFQIPVAGDGSLGAPVPLFVGRYGRLRTVVPAPDGTLWFSTSNRDGRGSARAGDDRILQFRP
ncbi:MULTISPECIES: PQQ-dependent sugar dehydrogenase [Mycolicibacterium]|uniref:Glucose sorbosone dehydrogenase n=1 Tax=Mycolicibacterium wolinskyi TaxID=59750 RepID=A0A1X2EZ45_9MYCO|nr:MULTISPECIES: PQQ-dependent sugar dehydrogenase [Mycolicibacterium]ORX11473.1 glucose sorbosone dehydrogenase [Mycolicibacterium wolinskyi]